LIIKPDYGPIVLYTPHFFCRVKTVFAWHDYPPMEIVPGIYNLGFHQNIFTMGNLLYVIAVILIIGWAIGFLGYSAGGIIHLLLVIAVILILLKVIRRA